MKGTFASYLGSALGFVNILILFPLFLSTEEIGLYRVLLDAASLFVIFSMLGTTDSTTKFFPYFKDQAKKHNGFLTAVLLVALIGLSAFVLIYWAFNDPLLARFAERAPLVLEYRFYVIPLTGLILLYNVFASYCRSLLRIVIPKLIREVLIRALLAIGTGLYYIDVLSLQELILWIIGMYAVALLVLILYVKQLGHLFLQPNFSIFKSDLRKEMSTFTLFTILGSGSGIIVSKIDTIMLGSMEGLNAAGVYGVAFYLGAIIQMPRRTLAEISSPIIATAFKEDNLDKVQELYQKTSLNLLIIGAFLFTGIWTNIDSVLQLIPNSENFLDGKYVVLYIGLAKLIDMGFGLNTEIITNSKFYKWNTFFLPFLALLTIASNLILIPKYGIVGAAMASFISIAFINVLRFGFIFFTLNIQPVTMNTVKALVMCAAAYYLGMFVPAIENIYLDILQRGTIVTVVYLVMLLLLKPSEDIDGLLKGYWRKIFSGNNS